MSLRDTYIDFINELMLEGKALLSTEFRGKDRHVYVDLAKFSKWAGSCRLLITQLDSSAKPWAETFTHLKTSRPYRSAALSMLASLESIKEAIDRGLLVTLEELIFAETFSDLMGQSGHLIESGYDLAGAVVSRAVLEERLMLLCVKNGCMPGRDRPTINDYNSELYKAKVYSKITMKQVDSMAAIGNAAAHNDGTMQPGDAAKFHSDLMSFLGKFSV